MYLLVDAAYLTTGLNTASKNNAPMAMVVLVKDIFLNNK
jgi:hypothetical protein